MSDFETWWKGPAFEPVDTREDLARAAYEAGRKAHASDWFDEGGDARVKELEAALRPRQDDNGDLIFQVRVRGIGAKPDSPRHVACELATEMERGARYRYYSPEILVAVEEFKLLTAQEGQEGGDAQ